MERQITSIILIGNTISIILNDGESALFTKFAKTIYTETSDNVKKKTLSEFKKDIVKYKWDVEKLKEVWIKKEELKHGIE